MLTFEIVRIIRNTRIIPIETNTFEHNYTFDEVKKIIEFTVEGKNEEIEDLKLEHREEVSRLED